MVNSSRNLTPEMLRKEQETTLASPVMKINPLLKIMIVTMDIIYGKKRTLPKFRVIEVLAGFPYRAWENYGYKKIISRLTGKPSPDKTDKRKEMYGVVELGRTSWDNEHHHLMIIDEIMEQKDIKPGLIRGILLPRLMGMVYYLLETAMMLIRPAWSYSMNARFESHAEHEYMNLVAEHPEWETEPVSLESFRVYPEQKTIAALFQSIGLDEREHMQESIQVYETATKKPLKA